VISCSVARRTNEIGIRLALGATGRSVSLLVLKESLLLAVLGIAIGLPLSIFASRLIAAKLFGVSAIDALTIIGACVFIIIVSTPTTLLPARRASAVDPVAALRCD